MRIPRILHSLSAVLVLLFVNLAWGAATEQVLYLFNAGEMPGGLVLDNAGNLYGTTYYGGTSTSAVSSSFRPRRTAGQEARCTASRAERMVLTPGISKAWFSMPPAIYTVRQLVGTVEVAQSSNSHRTAGLGR